MNQLVVVVRGQMWRPESDRAHLFGSIPPGRPQACAGPIPARLAASDALYSTGAPTRSLPAGDCFTVAIIHRPGEKTE
ncbi:MAG TPA: hypothetical protein VIZ18_04210 [Ktedonobacteraceae bacterium]